MSQRILFLIRDKLGDTLIAAGVAIAYARAHPEDRVSVMVRSYYAPLLADEKDIRVIHYRNAAQASLWALLTNIPINSLDAFVVLRGFGPTVASLGKLVNARRKLYMNHRFPDIYPEYPPPLSAAADAKLPIIDASWRVARLLDPDLPKPERLELPALRAKHRAVTNGFVGICPFTDERRKDLSAFAVKALIARIRRDYPDRPIRILIRQEGDGGFSGPDVDGVPVVAFHTISGLVERFSSMGLYFGADTGLYHVAVAMGITAHVVFGPTQPFKIVLPAQDTFAWRVSGLGERHCDEKSCRNPLCVDQAAANFAGDRRPLPVSAGVPAACPLLKLSSSSRTINSRYRHGRFEPEPPA